MLGGVWGFGLGGVGGLLAGVTTGGSGAWIRFSRPRMLNKFIAVREPLYPLLGPDPLAAIGWTGSAPATGC